MKGAASTWPPHAKHRAMHGDGSFRRQGRGSITSQVMVCPRIWFYDVAMTTRAHTPSFGEHLRHWRQHRRLSQLDLAANADISTRHLSYVETGRASPSREMVLRLTERLDVPLRERNTLLVAAGFAPMYRESRLDDPALASARQAVDLILKANTSFRRDSIHRAPGQLRSLQRRRGIRCGPAEISGEAIESFLHRNRSSVESVEAEIQDEQSSAQQA